MNIFWVLKIQSGKYPPIKLQISTGNPKHVKPSVFKLEWACEVGVSLPKQ